MVTLEEAQLYFDSKINSQSWDQQIPLQQKALNNAERILNALRFNGVANALPDQFPRDDNTTVPVAIQNAICEIAYALLDGVDPELEIQSLSLTKQTIASASTTFDHSVDIERIMAGVPSAVAWGLLLPYLNRADGFTIRRV